MAANSHHSEPLFGARIVRAATIGAVLGAIGVVVAFAAGIMLSNGDMSTVGAAGLVAPFGGAGFGGMIGGVLGAIKVHEREQEEFRAARRTPNRTGQADLAR